MKANKKNIQTSSQKILKLNDIEEGIKKIRKAIQKTENLKLKKLKYNDQKVEDVLFQIVETIKEVFGENSSEYKQYSSHRIWQGDYNTRDSDYERQQKFEKGIPETVTMLKGLIEWLEEKKEFAVSPKNYWNYVNPFWLCWCMLQKLWLILKYFKKHLKIAGWLGGFLAVVTFYFNISPKLEIIPNVSSKDDFPFETVFLIKNVGHLPLENIECRVVDKNITGNILGKNNAVMMYTNSPEQKVAVDTATISIIKLSSGRSTKVDIRKLMGLLIKNPIMARITIGVSYRNWIIPYCYKDLFSFELIKTFDNKYEWVPNFN